MKEHRIDIMRAREGKVISHAALFFWRMHGQILHWRSSLCDSNVILVINISVY